MSGCGKLTSAVASKLRFLDCGLPEPMQQVHGEVMDRCTHSLTCLPPGSIFMWIQWNYSSAAAMGENIFVRNGTVDLAQESATSSVSTLNRIWNIRSGLGRSKFVLRQVNQQLNQINFIFGNVTKYKMYWVFYDVRFLYSRMLETGCATVNWIFFLLTCVH